ncbi:hypothetical protein AAY473_000479 [Plecturocebus cupreus]
MRVRAPAAGGRGSSGRPGAGAPPGLAASPPRAEAGAASTWQQRRSPPLAGGRPGAEAPEPRQGAYGVRDGPPLERAELRTPSGGERPGKGSHCPGGGRGEHPGRAGSPEEVAAPREGWGLGRQAPQPLRLSFGLCGGGGSPTSSAKHCTKRGGQGAPDPPQRRTPRAAPPARPASVPAARLQAALPRRAKEMTLRRSLRSPPRYSRPAPRRAPPDPIREWKCLLPPAGPAERPRRPRLRPRKAPPPPWTQWPPGAGTCARWVRGRSSESAELAPASATWRGCALAGDLLLCLPAPRHFHFTGEKRPAAPFSNWHSLATARAPLALFRFSSL